MLTIHELKDDVASTFRLDKPNTLKCTIYLFNIYNSQYNGCTCQTYPEINLWIRFRVDILSLIAVA